MMSLRFASTFVGACLAIAACAHGTPSQDMTVEQHEAAARQDRKQENREVTAAYAGAPGTNPLNGPSAPELYLHPQSEDLVRPPLARAQILEQHAREHEQAAAELQHFEDAECKTLPAQERGTCPLLGSITGVQDIEGGVRIKFNDSARASALLPRMRCHQAYARAHGFTDSPDCALYIRGVDFRPGPDAQTIDIVASDPSTMPQVTAEIRKRVHASTD